MKKKFEFFSRLKANITEVTKSQHKDDGKEFQKQIVAIKLNLPTSVPSQVNVRIVAIVLLRKRKIYYPKFV